MTAPHKPAMSESQFQMWRGVIAIAHADGHLQAEERAHLEGVIANLDRVHGLSAEQKKILSDDLATPRKIGEILPLIRETQYRGALIHFGETMAWADGILSADEEDILKKLHASQMASLDMEKLRADVKAHVQSARAAHDREVAQFNANKKSPTLRAIDRLLEKLGFDV